MLLHFPHFQLPSGIFDLEGFSDLVVCDPGFGVLHFLMLHTVLNEKFTFPQLGHVQSLSRILSVPFLDGLSFRNTPGRAPIAAW